MRSSKRSEFTGTILAVRAIEDCIRASKKYTEGISTVKRRHPVQGEDFPSKVFCKYYEVYPDVEISWDMPVSVTVDWLWGETLCIDITFHYDYRANKASLTLGDYRDIKKLQEAIPGFGKALAQAAPETPAAEKGILATCPTAHQTHQDENLGHLGA